MPDPIRVGLLGAGRATFMAHYRDAFPADVTLAGICDIRPARADEAAARHGIARVYPTYEAMLDAPSIELVVVGTPDQQHAQQAIQAMEAGKHVLSEIPAAYEIAELQRLIDLEEKTNCKYAMANEVRWFPYLMAVKQMAQDGFWGRVFHGAAGYLHNLRRDGWRLIEPETGEPHWRFDPRRPQTTFLGGGPHAFDTLRWLMDETNWVEVFAYGNVPYVPPHEEPGHAVALLKSAGGAISQIEVSYTLARPYCLYFSLYGDRGTFETSRTEFGGLFFTEQIPHMERMTPLGVPYAAKPRLHTGVHGTSEIEMTADLISAIRQNRRAAINAREAARSIAPAICALESLRTGRPVAIPQF